MKKVSLILIILTAILLSCGDKQTPQDAAASSEHDSAAVEAQTAEKPAVKTDTTADSEVDIKVQHVTPEIEDSETSNEFEEKPAADLITNNLKISSQTLTEPPETTEITKISVIEELIKAIKRDLNVEIQPEDLAELDFQETIVIEKPQVVKTMPHFDIPETSHGKRTIIIQAPGAVAFYESKVYVRGYFSGFINLESASWILEGTDISGKLPLLNSEAFQFSIDTKGYTETLAVRIRAVEHSGAFSEELIILVNDDTGPEISITKPGHKSRLSEFTAITGVFTGEVKKASIELPETGFTSDLIPDSNGYFNFNIKDNPQVQAILQDNSTDLVIKITAFDFNENSSSEYIYLSTDRVSTGIVIETPTDEGSFSSDIIVSGAAEGFDSLSWDIPATGFSGITAVIDGNFSFPLKLSGLNDRLLLRISGESDNVKETSVIRLFNKGVSAKTTLEKPVNGDFYRETLTLSGNSSRSDGKTDIIKSLYWGIPGTENKDNFIFFDETGNFALDLGLYDYSGPLPLEIILEDYNNNIERTILKLQDGNILPAFELSQPGKSSEYGAFINIVGRITDPYEATAFGGITEASFEIASTDNYDLAPVTGVLDLSETNSFGVQLPAIELFGNQQLTLRTTASNGNKAEHVVNLGKSKNDLTSFQFSAVESEITADWKPVQTESSYTLYLTDDGTEPSEANGRAYKNVMPPLIIGDVKNGNLYKARLKADTEYGTLWSGIDEVIPAGAQTFNLTATGEFRKIYLNWRQISGTDSYSIYRSSNGRDFSLLIHNNHSTLYIDKDVTFGRDYYYYVTPADHDYARSAAAGASILKAPDERIIQLGKLSSFNPVDIDVTGNYIYTAAGDDGFRIVDLTTPENLRVTGVLEGFTVNAVTVRGDYAYIASIDTGLNIVNIMEPGTPFLAGRRTTAGAVDISVHGDYAYIADGESGLKIINITDSRNPERVATIKDINSTAVAIYNDYLFSNDNNMLQIFSADSPAAPEKISELNLKGITDMSFYDDIGYLTSTEKGLVIIDLTDINVPEIISATPLKNPGSIVFKSGFTYIADGSDGLKIYDVSDITNPQLFDSLKTGFAVAVDVSDDHVIVAEQSGLSAIQTFLQGVSFVLNKVKTGVKAVGIAIYESLAFIPSKTDGLKTYDISSYSDPVERIQDNTPEYSGIIKAVGRNLYLTTAPEQLSVFIIDAERKNILGNTIYSVDFPGTIKDFAVSTAETGTTSVSVSSGTSGTFIVQEGKIVSEIFGNDSRSSLIHGSHLFICDHETGFLVYSIAKTEYPELIQTVDISMPEYITTNDNYAFVTGENGIHILDISGPKILTQGQIKTHYAEKTQLKDNYLYIAEGYKGMSIYDISNPEKPVLVSICDTVYAADLIVKDDYAFISDGTGLNTVKIFIPDWLK